MSQLDPTVVVIDDDPEILVAIQRTLMRSAVRVLSCSDPIAGLEMVLKERPEAIIVDLQMPKMTGLELARRLHSDFQGELPQLILLSGSAACLPEEERALFDVVMQKPWSPQALRDLMPQVKGSTGEIEPFFGHEAHKGATTPEIKAPALRSRP